MRLAGLLPQFRASRRGLSANVQKSTDTEDGGLQLQDFMSPTNSNCSGSTTTTSKLKNLPRWLQQSPIALDSPYHQLEQQLRSLNLHTVCEEARCPNIGECWSGDRSLDREEAKHDQRVSAGATATIMLMGRECTRGCRFCAVKTNRRPPPLDPAEPANVAEAISQWQGLGYVVLTTVDRDDLEDSGAGHFAQTIQEILRRRPTLLVEALTGDFQGNVQAANVVAASGLHVFAHNLETVEELTPWVRDRRASYRQSLGILRAVKDRHPHLLTKSSLMLGLGETDEQVAQTLKDLRGEGVDVVTFGQYLQPTKGHLKVHEYVTPEKFECWRQRALEDFRFAYCASGPLVRSSYRAGEFYLEHMIKQRRSIGK